METYTIHVPPLRPIVTFQVWLHKAEVQAQSYDINAHNLDEIEDLYRHHQRFISDVRYHEADLQRVNHLGESFLAESKAFQKELENYLAASIPETLSKYSAANSQIWVLEQKLHEINDRYWRLLRGLSFKENLIVDAINKHEDFTLKLQSFMPWLLEAEHFLSQEVHKSVFSDEQNIYLKIKLLEKFQSDVHFHHDELVSIQISSDVLSGTEKYNLNRVENDESQRTWQYATESVVNRYEELCRKCKMYLIELQSSYMKVTEVMTSVDSIWRWAEETDESLDIMFTNEIHYLIQLIYEIKIIILAITVQSAGLNALKSRICTDQDAFYERFVQTEEMLFKLQNKANEKKIACVASFSEYVENFQNWMEGLHSKLLSNNLITFDIIACEEKLIKINEDLEMHRQAYQFINRCARELISLKEDLQTSFFISVLNNVNSKWQDIFVLYITHQKRYDEVVKFSEKFYATVTPFVHWLDKMETILSTLLPVAIKSQDIQIQLSELKALTNDAYNHKGTLEILINIGDSLVKEVKQQHEDKDHKQTPIEIEMETCRKRFDQIIDILTNRSLILNSTLSQAEIYQESYNKVIVWLGIQDDKEKQWHIISGKLEIVWNQYLEHLIYQKDLRNGFSIIKQTLFYGSELTQGKESLPGVAFVKMQCNELTERWNKLCSESDVRHNNLEHKLETYLKEEVQNVILWMKKKEKEINKMEEKNNPEKLDIYINELIVEIKQYEYLFFVIHQISTKLMETSKTEKVMIYKDLTQIEEYWLRLCQLYQVSPLFQNRVNLQHPWQIKLDAIDNVSKQAQSLEAETKNTSNRKPLFLSLNKDYHGYHINRAVHAFNEHEDSVSSKVFLQAPHRYNFSSAPTTPTSPKVFEDSCFLDRQNLFPQRSSSPNSLLLKYDNKSPHKAQTRTLTSLQFEGRSSPTIPFMTFNNPLLYENDKNLFDVSVKRNNLLSNSQSSIRNDYNEILLNQVELIKETEPSKKKIAKDLHRYNFSSLPTSPKNFNDSFSDKENFIRSFSPNSSFLKNNNDLTTHKAQKNTLTTLQFKGRSSPTIPVKPFTSPLFYKHDQNFLYQEKENATVKKNNLFLNSSQSSIKNDYNETRSNQGELYKEFRDKTFGKDPNSNIFLHALPQYNFNSAPTSPMAFKDSYFSDKQNYVRSFSTNTSLLRGDDESLYKPQVSNTLTSLAFKGSSSPIILVKSFTSPLLYEDDQIKSYSEKSSNLQLPEVSSEDIVITDKYGRRVRQKVFKKVTRTHQRIVRKKYIDENGKECIEEIFVPNDYEINNDNINLEEGSVIIHSPNETDTTTNEELVRDKDGNIIKRIVKKVTHVTKRSQIIKRAASEGDQKIDADSFGTFTLLKSPNLKSHSLPKENEIMTDGFQSNENLNGGYKTYSLPNKNIYTNEEKLLDQHNLHSYHFTLDNKTEPKQTKKFITKLRRPIFYKQNESKKVTVHFHGIVNTEGTKQEKTIMHINLSKPEHFVVTSITNSLFKNDSGKSENLSHSQYYDNRENNETFENISSHSFVKNKSESSNLLTSDTSDDTIDGSLNVNIPRRQVHRYYVKKVDLMSNELLDKIKDIPPPKKDIEIEHQSDNVLELRRVIRKSIVQKTRRKVHRMIVPNTKQINSDINESITYKKRNSDTNEDIVFEEKINNLECDNIIKEGFEIAPEEFELKSDISEPAIISNNKMKVVQIDDSNSFLGSKPVNSVDLKQLILRRVIRRPVIKPTVRKIIRKIVVNSKESIIDISSDEAESLKEETVCFIIKDNKMYFFNEQNVTKNIVNLNKSELETKDNKNKLFQLSKLNEISTYSETENTKELDMSFKEKPIKSKTLLIFTTKNLKYNIKFVDETSPVSLNIKKHIYIHSNKIILRRVIRKPIIAKTTRKVFRRSFLETNNSQNISLTTETNAIVSNNKVHDNQEVKPKEPLLYEYKLQKYHLREYVDSEPSHKSHNNILKTKQKTYQKLYIKVLISHIKESTLNDNIPVHQTKHDKDIIETTNISIQEHIPDLICEVDDLSEDEINVRQISRKVFLPSVESKDNRVFTLDIIKPGSLSNTDLKDVSDSSFSDSFTYKISDSGLSYIPYETSPSIYECVMVAEEVFCRKVIRHAEYFQNDFIEVMPYFGVDIFGKVSRLPTISEIEEESLSLCGSYDHEDVIIELTCRKVVRVASKSNYSDNCLLPAAPQVTIKKQRFKTVIVRRVFHTVKTVIVRKELEEYYPDSSENSSFISSYSADNCLFKNDVLSTEGKYYSKAMELGNCDYQMSFGFSNEPSFIILDSFTKTKGNDMVNDFAHEKNIRDKLSSSLELYSGMNTANNFAEKCPIKSYDTDTCVKKTFDAKMSDLLSSGNPEVLFNALNSFSIFIQCMNIKLKSFLSLTPAYDFLTVVKEEHKLFQQSLVQKEPEYDNIIQNGLKLLEGIHSLQEKNELYKQLEKITKDWDDINKASSKRQFDIDKLHLICRKYNCEYVTFNIYLTKVENQKDGFQPVSTDKILLQKQLAEAEQFYADVNENRSVYNNFITANESIFITCKELDITDGLTEMFNQVEVVKEKWTNLNSYACNRLHLCRETLQLLEDFDKKLNPIELLIYEVNFYANQYHLFGNDINQAESILVEIQKYSTTLKMKKSELACILKDVVESFCKLNVENSFARERVAKDISVVDELINKLLELNNTTVQNKATVIRLFEIIAKVSENLLVIQSSSALNKENSFVLEDISHQIKVLQELEIQLAKCKADIDYAEKNTAVIIEVNKNDEKLCSNVTINLSNLRKSFKSLANKISEKLNTMVTVKLCYENFMELKAPIEQLITSSVLLDRNLLPIEMNVDNEQIKLFKDLIAKLEDRKSDLKSANRVGLKLIGYLDNSENIERTLESINDSYFEVIDKLKGKVNIINEHCYKINIFNSLIDGIKEWVVECQHFIESFVMPKIDIENVNKQIEVIQNNLKNHRKYVLMLKEAQMIKNCSFNDHKIIFPSVEKQLKMVEKTMDDISGKLSELENQLFASLTFCKQYSFDESECTQWLIKTENELKKQKPISAKNDINCQQLVIQKNLVEDVQLKSLQFEVFFENVGDQNTVDAKKTAIFNRWFEIKQNVNKREKCLNEVVHLSEKFEGLLSVVVPWLNNAKKACDVLTSIPVKPNKLLKQISSVDEMITQVAVKKPIIKDFHDCFRELEQKAECDIEDISDIVNCTLMQFKELENNLLNISQRAKKMQEKIEIFKTMHNNIEELCSEVHSTCDKIKPHDVEEANIEKDVLQMFLTDISNKKLDIDLLKQMGNELILIDNQNVNVITINETVMSVEKKVRDAIFRIENMLENIEKFSNDVVKFQNMLFSAKMKSDELIKNSNAINSIGSTREIIKTQLSEINDLQNELKNVYNDFLLAEALADEIFARSNKEQSTYDRLQSQLQDTKKLLKMNESLADSCEQKLRIKLKSCGDLQDLAENILYKLKVIQLNIDQHIIKDLSINPDNIRKNIYSLQNLKNDIENQKLTCKEVLQNLNVLMANMENSAELVVLKGKSDELKDLWESVNNKVLHEITRLESVHFNAADLDLKVKNMGMFLIEKQKQVNCFLVDIPCVADDLYLYQTKVNDVTKSLQVHYQDIVQIKDLIASLESICQSDILDIQICTDKFEVHYFELTKRCTDEQSEIDKMFQKINLFNDILLKSTKVLREIEKEVYDATIFKANKFQITEVNHKLNDIEIKTNELFVSISQLNVICADIKKVNNSFQENDLNDLSLKLKNLRTLISQKSSDLKSLLNYWDNALLLKEKIVYDFSAVQTDILQCEPSIFSAEVITSHLEILKTCKYKIDIVEEHVENLTNNSFFSYKEVDIELFEGICSIEKQIKSFKTKIVEKEQLLSKLKDKCCAFFVLFDEASAKLTNLENKISFLDLNNNDKDVNDKQIQEVKDLNTELDRIKESVTKLNINEKKFGNKYPELSLEKAKSLLHTLNDKVALVSIDLFNRQSKLEISLQQSGKLNDFLKSLSVWLEENSKFVENQDAINAADENVLLAQIQEQKLLKRMFFDHEHNFTELQKIGIDLLKATNDCGKKKDIEADLKSISNTWNNLNKKIDERENLLLKTLQKVQILNTCLGDIVKKLEVLEIKVNVDKDLLSCDNSDTLKEQKQHVEIMLNEVLSIESMINQVYLHEQDLESFSTPTCYLKIKEKSSVVVKLYEKILSHWLTKQKYITNYEHLFNDLTNRANVFDQWVDDIKVQIAEFQNEIQKVIIVQKNIEDHKSVFNEIEILVKELNGISQSIEPQEIYNCIEEKYHKLITENLTNLSSLQKSSLELKEFYDRVESLFEWLDKMSSYYEVKKPSYINPDEVKEQLLAHQAISSQVSSMSHSFKNIYELAECLTSKDMERNNVQAKVDSLKLMELKLNENLTKRQNELVEDLLLIQKFSDLSKEFSHKLSNAETNLDAIKKEEGINLNLHKETLDTVEKNLLQSMSDLENLKELSIQIKNGKSNIDSITIIKMIDECDTFWKHIKLSFEKIKKSTTADKTDKEIEILWSKLEDAIEKCGIIKKKLKQRVEVPVIEDLIAENILKVTEQEKEINDLEDIISNLNKSIDLLSQEELSKSPALLIRQSKLNSLWKHIINSLTVYKGDLINSLDAAKKFWAGVKKLKDIILDMQTKIDEQGEPTTNVDILLLMISENQNLHKFLEENSKTLIDLSNSSLVLINNASTENNAEVLKVLNDVTDQWDALNKHWNLRKDSLLQLKNILISYNQDKDSIEAWLSEAENQNLIQGSKCCDLSDIRDKLNMQRIFYKDLTKHQSEIIALNQKGSSLVEKVGEEDAEKIREYLASTEQRWNTLVESSNQCQVELEDTLLSLGHYHIVIEELLTWITQTRLVLLERSVPKNKQSIEIELSKFRSVKKDVDSRRHIADSCIKIAEGFVKKGIITDRETIEIKLNILKTAWCEIQQLLQQKEEILNDALEETHKFYEQLQDLTAWLIEAKVILKRKIEFSDVESISVHLEKHSEFITMFLEHEENYEFVVETLTMMESNNKSISDKFEVQKTLANLKTDWHELKDLSQSKSDFLQSSLKNAELYQNLKHDIEIWFVQVYDAITSYGPVSTNMDVIKKQMCEVEELLSSVFEKQKCLLRLKEVMNVMSPTYSPSEAFSLNSQIEELTQHWKEVAVKLKERKKLLASNYEQIVIFSEGSNQLYGFLDDLEKLIDPSIGKDANSVKLQIRKNKENQKLILLKQAQLNATVKAGMFLISKSQCGEGPVLSKAVEALRLRWESVLDLYLDRQHRLEEALLFHGMFLEAVQALIEWLDSADYILTSEVAVMGDPETVKLLVDNHNSFQQELLKKFKIYESIVKTGQAMLTSGNIENAVELENYLEILKDKWEAVNHMSLTKEARVKNAYELANNFQKSWIACMQNLVVLDDELKRNGPIADELNELKKQVDVYYLFEKNLNSHETEVNACFQKGGVILRFCHPFAQSNIHHQMTLLKKRMSNISGWAKERKSKLTETLAILMEEETVTVELLKWISEQEAAFQENEREPLPDDFEVLSKMLEKHFMFQKDIEAKQLVYENVVKKAKRKPLSDQQRHAMTPRSRGSDKRDFINPKVELLCKRWQLFWLAVIGRKNLLQSQLDEIRIRKAAAHFKWEEWRDRYNAWLRDSKSRVLDMWRKYGNDKDNNLTREQFIQSIIDQSFCAERWELVLVFDRVQRRNHVFYQDFMDALKGRKRKPDKPVTESEQIHDIIATEVGKCVCCPKKFEMSKVGEGKYVFGEQHKLRLVRFLRSAVMVRVGGGWENLLDFLEKNDPCRAEGRTNVELREKFVMPDNSSQSMQSFTSNYGKNIADSKESSRLNVIKREGSYLSSGSGSIKNEKSQDSHNQSGDYVDSSPRVKKAGISSRSTSASNLSSANSSLNLSSNSTKNAGKPTDHKVNSPGKKNSSKGLKK